jgi:aminoglycoside 2''-phosphotransferase
MSSRIPHERYRVIAQHLPDVVERDIEVNSDGHDHIVYIVRRQLTFRFPRVPRRIQPTRQRFLDAFAPRSPIPVPLITITYDARIGGDYEVNRYLPGAPFEPALARTLSPAQRLGVAHELGAFLSALHGFPLETARELGVDEMDPTKFGAYVEWNPAAYPKYRQLVFPRLTSHERRWVERLFGEYITHVNAQPFAVRVTHADMWSYHILIDQQSARVTGVLDYWPRIADPANDFKPFEQYGVDFVAAVYQRYTLPRDKSFELRRLYYTGHDQVAELARAIEFGDTEHIAAQLTALKTYIAEHS